nr:immunoglobulin heavy chain junction region [Macaca mulatta]MOV49520.1 immunoglobulin heavy chain junction region [Macaca mulatta]
CAIHRFNGNYNRYYFDYW